MNSSDLIKLIHAKTHLKLEKIKNVLDTFPEIVAEELNKNEEVKISNFGTFVIVTYPPRPVTSPRDSSVKQMTPPRRVAKFKPTKNSVEIIRGHKKIEEELHGDEFLPHFENLIQTLIPKKILLILPEHFARHNKVAIVGKKDERLVGVTTQVNFDNLRELIKEKTGWDVILKNTNLETLNQLFDQYSEEEIKAPAKNVKIFKLKQIKEEVRPVQITEKNAITSMIQAILKQARHEEVRDIYLETGKDVFSIYFMKDNNLKEIAQMPIEIYDNFYNHVKIMSSLKIQKNDQPEIKWWLI